MKKLQYEIAIKYAVENTEENERKINDLFKQIKLMAKIEFPEQELLGNYVTMNVDNN